MSNDCLRVPVWCSQKFSWSRTRLRMGLTVDKHWLESCGSWVWYFLFPPLSLMTWWWAQRVGLPLPLAPGSPLTSALDGLSPSAGTGSGAAQWRNDSLNHVGFLGRLVGEMNLKRLLQWHHPCRAPEQFPEGILDAASTYVKRKSI